MLILHRLDRLHRYELQSVRTRKERAARVYWSLLAISAATLVIRVEMNRQIWAFLPFDVALFFAPFVLLGFLFVTRNLDVHRYAHIVEAHPVWARLVWQPDLGPKPLAGLYRRRCRRWLCLFRSQRVTEPSSPILRGL